MATWLKAGGIGGSILVIIALVITLLKSIISLIGFISVVLKLLLVLAFVAVLVGVGFLVLKGIQQRRKDSHNGV
jgi:hypothetical protein